MELSAPWLWLIAGLLLCAGETLAPGMFLLWLGLAAIGTGLLVFAFVPGFEWSLIVFALLAVVSVFAGRKVYGSSAKEGDRPFLNRRAEALVGRTFLLEHAIKSGEGRIRVHDTVWRVTGPDMPAGTRVKVAAVEEGSLLRVVQA